jgi:hypothetical protein
LPSGGGAGGHGLIAAARQLSEDDGEDGGDDKHGQRRAEEAPAAASGLRWDRGGRRIRGDRLVAERRRQPIERAAVDLSEHEIVGKSFVECAEGLGGMVVKGWVNDDGVETVGRWNAARIEADLDVGAGVFERGGERFDGVRVGAEEKDTRAVKRPRRDP